MKNKKIPYRAWLVWGLAAGFFFAEYFARVAPSVMVPELMKAFHVTALSLGALSAYFYYAYVSMQLPVGALVDRFGPHKLLTVMAGLCGIASIFFAQTHSLAAADISRFFMGIAAAFAFVGALKLASVWFPASKFGFLAGTTQALGMLGAAVGEGPVSVLVQNFGWRSTMLIIGSVLLILSILIGLIVRDRPKHKHIEKKSSLEGKRYSLLQSLYIVIKNPQTWVNVAFVGFLYAPTQAFAELWGPSYLHRVYALSPEVAASSVSMIFIGWGIGGPLSGFISDKIERRKPVLLFSILASFVFMCLVLYVPNLPIFLVFAFLFCYGLCNFGVATSYAVACEINPKPVAGTSMSFANMSSVLIGAAFQPLIGFLLDLHWDGRLVNGVPYYSAVDFRLALVTLPLCFLASLIFALMLHESYGGKTQR